jgi:asparagine synthase (glutamine-hydrolysing)
MCGVTGYRTIGAEPSAWAECLPAATRALQRRGPDDEGLWRSEDGRVGFGHRRLSILDLSAHGHQPMTSACGQWVMVFNGEIYNFAEIRADLEALGHRFAGSGDSEVILAAFAQWGPVAVERFLGMFAIALWHRASGELHLLRDRLGVKPLYYFWDGRVLAFASELKALRAYADWTPEVDRQGLLDYFRYGYIGHPRTIYRNVFKLAPAHRLTLGPDGTLGTQRYWSPTAQAGARLNQSEQDAADELEALMISAFRYRMVSDVPVGVFLSGGIDSSLVTAILQRHSSQQIRTFTIGFGESDFDEAPHAQAVARHLGTHQTTRILTPADAMQILPGWGDLYDEPFADASGIPTLLVSRVAAQDVKVALSADGGDELFSGYTSYEGVFNRLEKLARIPMPVRRAAAAGLRALPLDALDERLGATSALAAPTGSASNIRERIAPQSPGRHFDLAVRHFSDRELGALLGLPVPETRPGCETFAGGIGDQMCLWDLTHYMPEDILTKVDRATMAQSIEGREPLIDHRLVEFAFSIPFHFKRGALGSKHLLRKILYRYVPQEVVDRPKKGFSVPMVAWLRGELAELPRRYLDPARIRAQGLFDAGATSRWLERMHAGDEAAARKVWMLLAFQMWHERWMEAA